MSTKNIVYIAILAIVLLLVYALFVQKNWHLEAAEKTTALPETVWAWYEATDIAPTWDPLVGKIKLNGPFAVGTTGTNTAPNGMEFDLIFTEVSRFKSYTEVTSLFGAKMTFVHTLVITNGGCTINHEVVCTGFLSSVYGLLLRKEYNTKFPIALKNLARLASNGLPTSPKS
jgi:hypothetical protein